MKLNTFGNIDGKFEVLAMDFAASFKDPKRKPPATWTSEQLEAGELKFCTKNGCWMLVRKTVGIIKNYKFIPDKGQSVTYMISVYPDNLSHFKKIK